MKAIVFRELKANRKSLLIWTAAMLGMVAIGAAEYPTLVTSGDSLIPVLEMMPRIMRVMFGMDAIPVTTALGYYVCMYLWYCLVAFAHAAVLGATIISKEERDRTAEFIFTKPYPRKTIITGKIIAAVVNVALISLITLESSLTTLVPQMQGESILGEICITMLGMFFMQILFLAVGLLLSAVCKSHKTALSASVAFVLIAFVLSVIIEYVRTIDFLGFLTPFRYFTAPSLVENGFSIFYILLSVIIIAASCYFTYFMYQRRDLHN